MAAPRWLFRLVPLGLLGILAWFVRARNIVEDPDQQQLGAIVPVAVFLGLSVGLMVIAWWAAKRGSITAHERRFVIVSAALSVLWWVIRSLDIIVEDHSLAFTGVHLVLAGSIVFASVWAVAGMRSGSSASLSAEASRL